MPSAAICRTIHHILPHIASINSGKKLDAGVSCSKQGGGVIDVTCQSSIQIIVLNQCSLSFRSSPNAHATCGSWHCCSQSRSHTNLFCVLSQRFSRERETALSLEYLQKYWSSVLQTWHQKCTSQNKQNDTYYVVAMATILAPVCFCEKPNILICNFF